VAKLRATASVNGLVFKINMDAGHGGASGRYDALRETALDYAFILTELGRAIPLGEANARPAPAPQPHPV
jgi:oligopeptidase B